MQKKYQIHNLLQVVSNVNNLQLCSIYNTCLNLHPKVYRKKNILKCPGCGEERLKFGLGTVGSLLQNTNDLYAQGFQMAQKACFVFGGNKLTSV